MHEYLITLGKDYADKKIADTDIDNKIKAEINRFIGKEEKTVAATN